jgi:hypothetical protein
MFIEKLYKGGDFIVFEIVEYLTAMSNGLTLNIHFNFILTCGLRSILSRHRFRDILIIVVFEVRKLPIRYLKLFSSNITFDQQDACIKAF